MGFLDAILGRSKPVVANLDALFALPSGAVTLETEGGWVPTGQAGVCFKPVVESSFDQMKTEVSQILAMMKSEHTLEVKEVDDNLGFHWVVITEPDIEGLVSNVHVVNSGLQEAGFSPQLLCSVFGFKTGPDHPAHPNIYLIYLFKRGTFYPFAPLPGQQRDNALELHLKGLIAKDMKVEEDLTRWFPVWGVPVN